MGIVYRAVDSRLDRTVALKLLPLSAASSADRERRFVQEAKAASALNHPNIITIYDIDSQSVEGRPVHFIAMEFVAGETLDRLIGHKPLRVRDALKYAIQMADALAAAHAAGIIHRDLKPSNVMVTPQGSIKILDFGLAKLNELPEPDAYADTMQAEAVNVTEPGTILGTAAYMSPEQAEGGKIDARSDIFSFGSVLYEMVTGRQAFAGGSKLSSLSAILHKDPQPARDTVPDLPEELDRIIGRCLRKDPERRWQTMADVKVALEELREELESGKSAAIEKRSPGISRRLMVLAAVAGIVLGLAPGAYLARRFFRPAPPSFERLTFRHGDVTSAKFAPGGAIVFSAEWDGAPSTLFSTQPGDREARPLGLPPGRVLSIKPDGEMAVLFDQTGTLARVRLGGGAPREVLENVSGADWGPGGESLAVVRTVQAFRQLEYPIGTVLYRTDGRPPTDPRVSPDGTLVAFFDYDVEIGDFAVCVVGANRPKRVLSRGWRAVGGLRWSPNGDEIWFSGGGAGGDPALYAVSLSGKQRMLMQTAGWMVLQDVARDGRLLVNAVNSRLGILYFAGGDDKEHDLAWLDASLAYELSDSADSLLFVELSYGEGRNSAIYLRRTDGSPAVLLGYGNRPALSPDGKAVLCIRHQPDHSELLILPTGAGESRTLNFAGLHYESVEWFPDGKRILFAGEESGRQVRTWMCDLAEGKPRPLTDEGVRATLVSPDGRSFVLPGGGKLSLRAIDGGQVRSVADLQPGEEVVRWSGDGQYLFVRRLEGASVRISRVRVATGRREPWREIKAPATGASFFGPLALSADGKALACTFQRDISNLFLVKGVR